MSRAVLRPDWVLDAPPAELLTPWATVLVRRPDGLYREDETYSARSAAAWHDRFARHHEQGRPLWLLSPAGVRYVPDGDRFGFLWQVLDLWSAGHAATAGERDVVRLLHSVPFTIARRAVEEWVAGRRAGRVVDVDARLGV